MITLTIGRNGNFVDIRFPCTEKVLTDALKEIGVNDELDTKQTVSEVVDFEVLSLLEGQEVDLDEINFLAKRLDSLTKPELDKFIVVTQMEGLDEPKDLINLTYNLNRYTLIQNRLFCEMLADRVEFECVDMMMNEIEIDIAEAYIEKNINQDEKESVETEAFAQKM